MAQHEKDALDRMMILASMQNLHRLARRTALLRGRRIDGEPSININLTPNGTYEITFLTSLSLDSVGGLHHVSGLTLPELRETLAAWLAAAAREHNYWEKKRRWPVGGARGRVQQTSSGSLRLV